MVFDAEQADAARYSPRPPTDSCEDIRALGESQV